MCPKSLTSLDTYFKRYEIDLGDSPQYFSELSLVAVRRCGSGSETHISVNKLILLDVTLFYPNPLQLEFMCGTVAHRRELMLSFSPQLEEREDILDHDTCTRRDASLLPHALIINLC